MGLSLQGPWWAGFLKVGWDAVPGRDQGGMLVFWQQMEMGGRGRQEAGLEGPLRGVAGGFWGPLGVGLGGFMASRWGLEAPWGQGCGSLTPAPLHRQWCGGCWHHRGYQAGAGQSWWRRWRRSWEWGQGQAGAGDWRWVTSWKPCVPRPTVPSSSACSAGSVLSAAGPCPATRYSCAHPHMQQRGHPSCNVTPSRTMHASLI